jgi:hypothetical protein
MHPIEAGAQSSFNTWAARPGQEADALQVNSLAPQSTDYTGQYQVAPRYYYPFVNS